MIFGDQKKQNRNKSFSCDRQGRKSMNCKRLFEDKRTKAYESVEKKKDWILFQ